MAGMSRSTNESGSSRHPRKVLEKPALKTPRRFWLQQKRRPRRKREAPRHVRSRFYNTMIRSIHESIYAKVDASDPLNTTNLHYAVARGDAKSVRLLLAAGASPNDVDVAGDTPLLLAVISHRVDLAQQLIDAGANVNAYTDSKGNTCLHHAIMKRNVEMVQLLISAGASLSVVNSDSERYTPLLMVFKRRDVTPLDEIRAQVGTPHNCSILHPQISQEDVDIIQLLLRAGASPNSVGIRGDTPLLLAIRSERIDLVQLLIDAGADVNYVYRDGRFFCHGPHSPLHETVHVCSVEILKLLLDKGADPNRANRILRYTVLFDASKANCNKIPMLNLLLDHGADMYDGGAVAQQNEFDSLPFEERLKENDVEVVRLFLKRGYDLSRFRRRGEKQLTPLHQAVAYYEGDAARTINTKDISMLQLLTDHYESKGTLSFELEQEDSGGRTALFYAVEGRPGHTKLLLQAGANPNYEVERGLVPLEVVLFECFRVHNEIIKLLIEAGADLRNVIKHLIDVARREGETVTSTGNVSKESSSSVDSDESDGEDAPEDIVDNLGGLLLSRQIFHPMEKASCVVKYRVLYESRVPVKDPIRRRIKCSSTLRSYRKACKVEISFLKNYQFDDSVTAFDLLTEENFWRRVKSSDAFEKFRIEISPDSEKVFSRNIQIYGDDVRRSWKFGYNMYKLWKSAKKGLKCLLGFDRDSYNLIFSTVLDRLDHKDWCNLSEIAGVTYNRYANSDASSHNDSDSTEFSEDLVMEF